jgi:hypothetical protein
MSDESDEDRPDAHRRARRRRALDDVFGDVLPSVTSDESSGSTDPPRPSRAVSADERDEEIRRDVPPHHR